MQNKVEKSINKFISFLKEGKEEEISINNYLICLFYKNDWLPFFIRIC